MLSAFLLSTKVPFISALREKGHHTVYDAGEENRETAAAGLIYDRVKYPRGSIIVR